MIENKARPLTRPKLPCPPNNNRPMAGPDFLVVDGALTRRDCDMLADRAGPDHNGVDLHPDGRELTPILGAVERLARQVAADHYGADPDLAETKLLAFRSGDYMRTHRDNEYEGAVITGGYRVSRVPVAVCIYLTEPKTYGGGGLVVADHPAIRPAQGTAVFVRGDVEHRVNEVTHGKRVILKMVATVPTATRWRLNGRTWRAAQ